MTKIQPVDFPLNLGTADKLQVHISADPSRPGAHINYILLNNKVRPPKNLSNGVLDLTEEQFIAYGNDKEWIVNYVIDQLGVTKIVD